MRDFARGDVLPSYWTDALEEYISALVQNLYLSKLNSTTLRIAATSGEPVAIGISGKWRYITANVDKALGGSAGTYDVFVTASNNNVVNTPQSNTDNTVYAFDIAVVSSGGTPTLNPGVVDIYRKIGNVTWDGAAITDVHQTLGKVTTFQIEDSAVITEKIADDAVTASKIAADAVGTSEIAADAVTASEIAAGAVGNSELAAGSVDGGKVAGSLKPSGSAATTDEALRALGSAAGTACAGDDPRLTDSRTPTGAAGGALDGNFPNPGLNASVAGNGLAEASDVLSVNVDGVTIEISGDALRLKDLGITAAKIANDTITATQIAANGVGTSEIANSAVTSGKIATGAVTTSKLPDATGTGDGVTLPKLDLNLGLTDDYLASPNNATWKTIAIGRALAVASDFDNTSAARLFTLDGKIRKEGVDGTTGLQLWRLVVADFDVPGKVTHFRMRGTVVTNGTKPSSTATAVSLGIAQRTSNGGASGNLQMSVSNPIRTASMGNASSWAANSTVPDTGEGGNTLTDGLYAFCVYAAIPALAAGAVVEFIAELQVSHQDT